ncbi:MAG: hypothetical protein IKO49_02155 [Bacilli bacterium]|nr:hypothetical protein [Clostridia bacterium]MBR4618084.1 hypothetical protein [Bacilli bacterium]
MKKSIRVHIIPTYKSNQNDIYDFFNQFYKNDEILDLVWLNNTLDELDKKFIISKYEIEGGEISLLSDFYFELLYNLLKIHCKKIITTTNFINFNKGIINLSDIINVIYNFNLHDTLNQQIFKNIKAAIASNKIINIKTVDISLKNDEIKNINILNNLNIKSWEIIPYFNSKDYTIFEEIIKKYLKYTKLMKFAFQNELQLKNILNLNNFETFDVYLLPENKFGLKIFENDQLNLEKFDNIDTLLEKLLEMEILHDNYCKKCTSKLKCMSNYFFNHTYKGKSCSGFKNLIKDFENKE